MGNTMSISSRLIEKSQPTVSHMMSRTALEDLPSDDVANDQWVELIRDFSRLYLAEILGVLSIGRRIGQKSERCEIRQDLQDRQD